MSLSRVLSHHFLPSVLILPKSCRRSLSRGVGGSGTTGLHGVDGGTGVLRHVVVSHRACNGGGCVPNKDGALRTSCHDELLVRRDGNLESHETEHVVI